MIRNADADRFIPMIPTVFLETIQNYEPEGPEDQMTKLRREIVKLWYAEGT